MKAHFAAATVILTAWPAITWACDSDTECKGDRVCNDHNCVDPTEGKALLQSPPAPVPPPPPPATCQLGSDCAEGFFCVAGQCVQPQEEPRVVVPAPPPPPVLALPPLRSAVPRFSRPPLVMRNKAMRDAGQALVVIGIVLDVAGFVLLGSNQGLSGFIGGAILVPLGICPFICNGSWMWPVGGAMIPQDPVAQLPARPAFVALRDGGNFGLKFDF